MSKHPLTSTRHHPAPLTSVARSAIVWMVVLLLTGCTATPQLDTSYGKTGGTPGLRSINGTSVLAEMFERQGATVTTVNRFSPRLERADIIVWAPDDAEPPSTKHRQYLNDWLAEREGRTVIYIGRDYDGTVDYWRQALPHAKPEQAAEYQRKLAEAISQQTIERRNQPSDQNAGWFDLEAKPYRTITKLEGPWSAGIDPTKTKLELGVRYTVPEKNDDSIQYYDYGYVHEVLLSSNQEPLVMQVASPQWYDSQLLVVTNGSFLLNLPLVNQEHRKLAGRLIEATEPRGRRVVFVESEAGGPPIRHREERPQPRTGFEMLTVWPLNVVLLHLLFWLLLVCVCLYPVFGRPRQLYGVIARRVTGATSPLASLLLSYRPEDIQDESPTTSGDFGRHLNALGEMLSLTSDHEYATAKLQHYHDHIKRDSGVAHAPVKTPTSPTKSSH